jgi:chaperonin GroES
MELETKIKTEKLLTSPNIAEMLTDEELNHIGYNVTYEFNIDKESRSQWEKRVEEAMKLALQVAEAKSFPWSGASNVKFPLITMAALQFHSRAYPALIPSGDLVKIDTSTEIANDKDLVAKTKRVEKHMSYQLMEEDENWEQEMDKVLITVPIVGCAFKKTYWDFDNDHPISENILAKDFVVSYWTKNLSDCTRQTHVLYLSKNDVLSRQRRGLWRDIDLSIPQALPQDNLTNTQNRAQGVDQPTFDPATPYEFLEQHRWEDLDGDGFKEPYVITVHKETSKVVRIVANYFEDSIKRNSDDEIIAIKPETYFTKYSFIPSPDGGFYDIGFGILLGPTNESINTIINQLIDAGTMATTAGGFLSRGIKVRGGNYNFAPLEWKHVDSTGEDLAKGIVPLPVREPSQVLFTLLTTLINYGERIIGATDIMVGENVGQNTPAATSQTMAEQGSKVFAGIFKRIYRSLKEELRRIYRLNQLYLPPEHDYNQGSVLASDYSQSESSLHPAADPHVITDTQRLMQATALRELALSAPGFNIHNVLVRYLEAMKVNNIDEILPDPNGPNAVQPTPNPKVQVEQMKVQIKQADMQLKMKLAMMKLAQEAEVNRAKIMKMEAEAVLAIEQAGGVQEGHKIAMLEAQIGAARAHQDGILRSIEIMSKAMGSIGESEDADRLNSITQQPGANPPGVSGMAAAPSYQGTPQGPIAR